MALHQLGTGALGRGDLEAAYDLLSGALGIRVAPIEEGDPRSPQKLPMARSAVRALIKYVPDLMSLVAVLAGIAGLLQIAILLWALSNRLRQGLDDLAASSVVRRTR